MKAQYKGYSRSSQEKKIAMAAAFFMAMKYVKCETLNVKRQM